MVKQKEAACQVDKRAVFMLKEEVIPGAWKSQKEAIIAQYHPDPVENTMEEKQNIIG